MTAALRYCLRIASYSLFVCFLVACGRSQDIANPQPLAEEPVPDCPITLDIDLISSLTILGNVSGGNDLSTIPLFQAGPESGFDSAISAGQIGFNSRVPEYYAEAPRFVDLVRSVAIPVLASNDSDITEINVSYRLATSTFETQPLASEGGVSSLVGIGDFRSTDDSVQITEIILDVSATVINSALYLTCFPSNIDPEGSTILEATYSINVGYDEELVRFGLLNDTTNLRDVPIRSDEEFGYSVALFGDTLVVGAPGNDNGDANYFGVNRLISVDGALDAASRAFLDNLNDDSSLQDSGLVYVFERDQGQWRIDQIIKHSFPDAGDRFGEKVAIDGDVLVVSAPGEDSIASGINGVETNNIGIDSGAVFVYERQSSGPEWIQRAFIKAPDNVTGVDGFEDDFGVSIALSGDQLAIGAPKDDRPQDLTTVLGNVGSVFVYSNESGDWTFSETLSPPIIAADTEFGSSVALTNNAMVVGAPGESSTHRGIVSGSDSQLGAFFANNDNSFSLTNADSGAVIYFGLDGGSWDLEAYIKSDNSDAGDRFGSAVTINETGRFAASAPFEDGEGVGLNRDMFSNDLPNSGAVYSFSVATSNDGSGVFNFQNYIKDPFSSASGAQYGVALASDNTTLAIGSPFSPTDDVGVQGYADVYFYTAGLSTITAAFRGSIFDDSSNVASELNGFAVDISGGRFAFGSPGLEPILRDINGAVLSTETSAGFVGIYE